METMNHEYYVSSEIAKLLEKAGFDWEIKTFYFNNELHETILGEAKNHNFSEAYISAPTLEVAQRWLRENLNLIITVEYNEYNYQTFLCKVYSNEECLSILLDFPIYEEAQEAGIKKALEIILENGE